MWLGSYQAFCHVWLSMYLNSIATVPTNVCCRKAQLASVLSQPSFGQLLLQFLDLFIWLDQTYQLWPQIRQDYPLNLSILISGGKETNKDSPSNGEWSGNSSSLKSPLLATANCSLEKRFQAGYIVLKLLGTAHRRGWQSRTRYSIPVTMRLLWVGLLGNAAQNGR